MIPVPSNKAELLDLANILVEQCRVSVGVRSGYYRQLNAIAETGRFDGTKALINMLNKHLDRTAAHLFSPIQLRFAMDFERPQPRMTYDRATESAKVLTRLWERNGTAKRFHNGVYEALKYGACVQKQWVTMAGPEMNRPCYHDKLVMPWQFGVFREDENSLDNQEALCETVTLTMPEIWQRIYHMDDARKLFTRIATHAQSGQSGADPQSFFHQVLSTSQIDSSTTQRPGGIMQLNHDPSYSIMGPVIAPATVQMHELWVKDEEDYTTIQMIEPDIIIAPLYKKSNLLVKDSQLQPYRLIQPNQVTNWIWGRSELVDLVEPQALLAVYCDDSKRLMGLQIDKIMGFTGDASVTDEQYGQFRNGGYINLGHGGGISDVTPKFPPELLPMIKFQIEMINTLGGFPNIMQGQGEAGVRASVHAETLLKTAAPTLRDRSLLVEQQCASAADLTFELMQAKDEGNYWLKADDPVKDVDETKFLLADVPDDRRIVVDSHSSSPIFSDENTQLIMAGAKMGYVDGDYVLENLPFPNKEMAQQQLKDRGEAKRKQMEDMLSKRPDLTEIVLKSELRAGKKS